MAGGEAPGTPAAALRPATRRRRPGRVPVRLGLLCSLVRVAAAQDCGETLVQMDLSERTNAAIFMDWDNAAGAYFSGQKNTASGTTQIAAGADDQGSGAFPRGSVRFRDAVTVRQNVRADPHARPDAVAAGVCAC